VPNPRQGILDGAQEFAVCLMQPDLHGCVSFAGGYIDRVPVRFTCGVNRIDQTLAGGEFLSLREEEILIAKQVALVHGTHPIPFASRT
jgi:hypothetical protein